MKERSFNGYSQEMEKVQEVTLEMINQELATLTSKNLTESAKLRKDVLLRAKERELNRDTF